MFRVGIQGLKSPEECMQVHVGREHVSSGDLTGLCWPVSSSLLGNLTQTQSIVALPHHYFQWLWMLATWSASSPHCPQPSILVRCLVAIRYVIHYIGARLVIWYHLVQIDPVSSPPNLTYYIAKPDAQCVNGGRIGHSLIGCVALAPLSRNNLANLL